MARGNAGMLRLDLYARVRFPLCRVNARPRVQQAPGVPCALYWAEEFSTTRAHCAARARRHVMRSSLRGAFATKQSTLSFFMPFDGLLRYARNEGVKSAALSPQPFPCQPRAGTQRHQ